MNQKLFSTYIAVILIYLLAGCSSKEFQSFSKVGTSVLGKTGVVSQSQADSLFEFGGSINSSAESITDEQEYYVGRGVSAHILGRYQPYNNSKLTDYLNKIALIISAVSDRPETFEGYKVQILDSPEINALSVQGGFIFLTKGIIKIIPIYDALDVLMAI